MKSERRLLSCILILLVVFVLFTSFLFILHESNHDCEGESCPVCAMIAVCRNTLKSFSVALILIATLLSSLCSSRSDYTDRPGLDHTDTPVSLKVRLLN